MDKFDVMEVNEKQRKRIDHLLSVVDNQLRKITKHEKRIEELLEEAGQMIRFIRHKEKIIKTQQEYIDDLESQLQNLKEQIDEQTDWRNFVQ